MGTMTALNQNQGLQTEATPELKKLLGQLQNGDALSIVEGGVVIGQLRRADNTAPWELALKLGKSVPESAWDSVPKDLAENFDHYHYDHPRDK
jgi:hypothetical protein